MSSLSQETQNFSPLPLRQAAEPFLLKSIDLRKGSYIQMICLPIFGQFCPFLDRFNPDTVNFLLLTAFLLKSIDLQKGFLYSNDLFTNRLFIQQGPRRVMQKLR